MPVFGEKKTWPDTGNVSTWDGEKWVLDGGVISKEIPPLGGDGGFMGDLRRVTGSDGDASSEENWVPGAFGRASLVPSSLNFNPCQWLYENTGIKCWWIIAAAAAYFAVRAVRSSRRR